MSHPALAGSEAPQYAVGIGFDASTGTFGTDSTSSYASVPFMVDWFPTERIYFELFVPLVYQRTKNTGLAATGGTVKSTARRIMGGGLYSYTGGSAALTSGAVADESVSGLGDITLTGGYALVLDSETTPYIRPTFYVKFPTADDTKGLSTGKLDVGPGLAVSKWLGNWQPFAEGRYIFQGASYDETGAMNFLTADAGVGYSWGERLFTSVYGRSGSRLFDGMEAPLEARLKVVWRFGERTYTEAYALKGFSDGSPDYGGGVSVFKEF
ncbi:MAG: hypothetical protein ACYDHC_13270 [Desulfuromonadaceae bacterium]